MIDERERAQRYYDAFAATYEDARDGRSRYHDLLDDLEVALVERYGRDRDVLEVGCGTGLLLRRFGRFAKRAVGVDLSPGMLARARERALDVHEGDALALPFEAASFDVVCSFKTLPHVPDLSRALAEMARVCRVGGVVIAETYNPWSLRALTKALFPARSIGAATERDVLVRYDDRRALQAALPSNLVLVGASGARVLVPFAAALEVPIVGRALDRFERAIADRSVARLFGGFVAWVLRRVD